MIGDTDVDVLTARRAGARSLGCGFGLAPHARYVGEAANGPDALLVLQGAATLTA